MSHNSPGPIVDDLEIHVEEEDHHYHLHFDRHLLIRLATRGATYRVILFAASAVFITVFRLILDCVSAVYLVHSLVIFVDLVLANALSSSWLFNLALNIVALTCTLLFKCFGLLLIELVETTLMAVLASLLGLYLKFRTEVYDTPAHHFNLHEGHGQTLLTFLVEEFLDGAAGIMYTSFAGLVFAEMMGLLVDHKAPVYCLWNTRFLGVCPS